MVQIMVQITIPRPPSARPPGPVSTDVGTTLPLVLQEADGAALGLVYSSSASISAALRCGRGVYWSRSRHSLCCVGSRIFCYGGRSVERHTVELVGRQRADAGQSRPHGRHAPGRGRVVQSR